MRREALSVFGIETRWRKRAAPPKPFIVEGPWSSEAEVSALVRSVVDALGLSPEVSIQWRSAQPEPRGPAADLVFGRPAHPSSVVLPSPEQLRGADARRAAWNELAKLRRTLRQQGQLKLS